MKVTFTRLLLFTCVVTAFSVPESRGHDPEEERTDYGGETETRIGIEGRKSHNSNPSQERPEKVDDILGEGDAFLSGTVIPGGTEDLSSDSIAKPYEEGEGEGEIYAQTDDGVQHDPAASGTEFSDGLSAVQDKPNAEGIDDAEHSEVVYENENEHLENLVMVAENAMRIERDGVVAIRYFRAAGVLGHLGALTSAASLLLSGDLDVPRDIGKAVSYLRLAAAGGQADAQAFLGTLYMSGLAERHGLEKSAAKAVLHWRFAAEMHNVYAAMALGYRYYTGTDVAKSCKKAVTYYYSASKAVARDPATWPSWRNFVYGLPPLPSKLRSPDRERIVGERAERFDDARRGRTRPQSNGEDDVLHYYRHSAHRGNLEAQTTIGALHFFGGHGMARDERLAEAQLRRASAAGSGDATAMLAHIKMRRDDSPDAVISLFQRAASLGNKHGHYGLGMIFLYGLLGQQQNYKKAMQHFKLAEDARHPEAAFHLGRMYTKGLGVNKSRIEAFQHFQVGAQMGNVQCEYAMGVYYLNGLGPVRTPHCDKAVSFLKRVAEKGDWRVVFDAGTNALNVGDLFAALYRFSQAAHAGIELGQYNAAMVLEQAVGGAVREVPHWDRPRIVDEAQALFTMSGKQGYPAAVVRAGNLAFLEKRDYTSAARAYELGYQLKNAEASFCLGWMYVRGLGVPRDRYLALRYMNSAVGVDRKEAMVPVSVALVGVRLWWAISDLAKWLGVAQLLGALLDSATTAISTRLDGVELHARTRSKLQLWSAMAEAALRIENRDFVAVVLLGVTLLAVISIRKRRLDLVDQR